MNANNKEIRQAVVNHIGEHTSREDYGVGTWKEVIYRKMSEVQQPADKYPAYGGIHPRTAGARQVEGGSFLIYHGEIEEFLLTLHYTPESACMKDDETRWEQYQQLVGRAFYDIVQNGYEPQ